MFENAQTDNLQRNAIENILKKERIHRNIHYIKDSPVIAILTIPNTFSKYKRTHSYLPNSYVKWIEMSGGRVVPVQYDLPTNPY